MTQDNNIPKTVDRTEEHMLAQQIKGLQIWGGPGYDGLGSKNADFSYITTDKQYNDELNKLQSLLSTVSKQNFDANSAQILAARSSAATIIAPVTAAPATNGQTTSYDAQSQQMTAVLSDPIRYPRNAPGLVPTDWVKPTGLNDDQAFIKYNQLVDMDGRPKPGVTPDMLSKAWADVVITGTFDKQGSAGGLVVDNGMVFRDNVPFHFPQYALSSPDHLKALGYTPGLHKSPNPNADWENELGADGQMWTLIPGSASTNVGTQVLASPSPVTSGVSGNQFTAVNNPAMGSNNQSSTGFGEVQVENNGRRDDRFSPNDNYRQKHGNRRGSNPLTASASTNTGLDRNSDEYQYLSRKKGIETSERMSAGAYRSTVAENEVALKTAWSDFKSANDELKAKGYSYLEAKDGMFGKPVGQLGSYYDYLKKVEGPKGDINRIYGTTAEGVVVNPIGNPNSPQFDKSLRDLATKANSAGPHTIAGTSGQLSEAQNFKDIQDRLVAKGVDLVKLEQDNPMGYLAGNNQIVTFGANNSMGQANLQQQTASMVNPNDLTVAQGAESATPTATSNTATVASSTTPTETPLATTVASSAATSVSSSSPIPTNTVSGSQTTTTNQTQTQPTAGQQQEQQKTDQAAKQTAAQAQLNQEKEAALVTATASKHSAKESRMKKLMSMRKPWSSGGSSSNGSDSMVAPPITPSSQIPPPPL